MSEDNSKPKVNPCFAIKLMVCLSENKEVSETNKVIEVSTIEWLTHKGYLLKNAGTLSLTTEGMRIATGLKESKAFLLFLLEHFEK